MTVDELVNKMRKPVYILTLCMHNENDNTPHGRSCKTRATNARVEIEKLVKQYITQK
jgi:hypothetical protein